MAIHDEAAFETAIEADLLADGWAQGASSNYRPEFGLDTTELMTFLGATQAKAFDKLIGYYGSQPKAQRKVAERIAKDIDARGTLDVLRRGVKDHGVLLRLAYFAPAQLHHPGAAGAVREEPADRHPTTALLGHDNRRAGSCAVRQRHPGRDRGAEERVHRPERRARQGAVPHRPRPARVALRQAGARALRRRPGPRVPHHAAGPR